MAKHVIGITELNRQFRNASTQFLKEKQQRLRGFARPVQTDAQSFAFRNQVGVPWSRMRIGSTPVSVYVAPQQKGSRVRMRKRRNFARFLIRRAMQPAVDKNRAGFLREINQLVARMERRWNRG